MKKRNKKKVQQEVELPPIKESGRSDVLWKYMIAFLAFVSFGLSVLNDYALDDFVVLVNNVFVQDGIKGIWKILSNDTFLGNASTNLMSLFGGRYRPLSLVTFAIEHQLWGNHALMSHLLNVLIYVITGVLLYNLLKSLLAYEKTASAELIRMQAAFMAILFIVLPCHSEEVINIKGRDDLLCLLFFILAVFTLLNYVQSGTKRELFLSALFYFLSLLSKETALTFLPVFPLILYFFTNSSSKQKYFPTFIYFILALAFLLFRYLSFEGILATPSDVLLNNPFANASTSQRFATVLLTWLLYLKLLIWPGQLLYDYNFNQIPLTDFSDWRVILSLVIHLSLILFALWQFRKKSIYSFAILFYVFTFSIVSNLFINVGTLFAERFVFIPSIGYCIIVVRLGFDVYLKFLTEKNRKILSATGIALAGIIVLLFCIKNMYRCPDWKDNNTLFLSDLDGGPQNAKIQMNAGMTYVTLSEGKKQEERDSLLDKAIFHFEREIEIYPEFLPGYFNIGVAYIRKENHALAEKWWNKAREIDPQSDLLPKYDKLISNYYNQRGMEFGADKNFREAADCFKSALRRDSTNSSIFYNLGGVYYEMQVLDSARYFFMESLRLNPKNDKAIQGMQAIEMKLQKSKQ
jgi:tetratricopeptide (TPR) repeat protein